MMDNEDIVYDNYDPSEFLRERFNQPVVMSEDEDSRQNSSGQQVRNQPDDQQEMESNDKTANEASNFEQDFELSNSDDEGQMQVDQDADDDQDVWF